MSALGYEWSDTSHCNGQNHHPALDMLVIHALALRMSVNAGPTGSYEDISPISDMERLVYSVYGGLGNR